MVTQDMTEEEQVALAEGVGCQVGRLCWVTEGQLESLASPRGTVISGRGNRLSRVWQPEEGRLGRGRGLEL